MTDHPADPMVVADALMGGTVSISLTRGQIAIIDAVDYSLIRDHSWHAHLRRDGKGFYAVNTSGCRMHRLLCGVWDSRIVDHRDGDGLNNRRNNIRIGTQSQNCVNRRTTPGKYLRGVSKRRERWRATIKFNGVNRHIGYYATEQEAHEAFLRENKKLHGDWQPLPTPPVKP